MNDRYRVVPLIVLALAVILLVVTQGRPQNLFGGRSGDQLQSALLRHAEDNFGEVNRKIQTDYGFDFKEQTRNDISCYDSRDALNNKRYDTCQLYNRAEPVTADSAFIADWRKTSPALEEWLQDNGWHKTWNQDQPIAEILDKPQNSTSIGVNYEKISEGIRCVVAFTWVQPHDPNQLNASEQCAGSTF